MGEGVGSGWMACGGRGRRKQIREEEVKGRLGDYFNKDGRENSRLDLN